MGEIFTQDHVVNSDQELELEPVLVPLLAEATGGQDLRESLCSNREDDAVPGVGLESGLTDEILFATSPIQPKKLMTIQV